MPAIYQHSVTVCASDLDPLGHVNNVRYFHWMQSAAIAHSAAQGWDEERYRRIGAAWIVRSHNIEYFQPALGDDEVTVYTWVSNMRKVRSLRKYKIVRSKDNALLARASTDWVFISRDANAPKRIPKEIASSFELVEENEEP